MDILKRFTWPLATAVMLCAAPGPAAAGSKIYKWVDQHGHVHYGERPAGGAAQEMRLSTRTSSTAPAQRSAEQRRAARDRLLKAFALERAEQQQRREADAASQARIDERCNAATVRLAQLQNARYLYREGTAGQPQVLSDEERHEHTGKLQAAIDRHCS